MTTTAACHRHDISGRAWAILEPILPGGLGKVGRPAQNNRRFTPYSGSSAPASPGATCPRTTDTGHLPAIASATGRRTALGSAPGYPGQRPRLGVADD